MKLGRNPGSITLNCKICKLNDTIVANVNWSDMRHRSDPTKEKLLLGRRQADVRPGASNAYWCPTYEQWVTESCGSDFDCCKPDRAKALDILDDKLDILNAKIKFIKENWK